jgi:hypothetical protein
MQDSVGKIRKGRQGQGKAMEEKQNQACMVAQQRIGGKARKGIKAREGRQGEGRAASGKARVARAWQQSEGRTASKAVRKVKDDKRRDGRQVH